MTIAQRLLRRTAMRPRGCWQWKGPKYATGYGQMHVAEIKAPRRVHRLSYELFVGPIPEGYEIHHLCGQRDCIRPTHLQAVHPTEHPGTASTLNRQKTHCPRGHEYDYIRPSDGARMCRRCRRERAEERKAA